MGKGIGLIGNFKGKVGNTVGYKLTASNNGQTQGIRVYQPIVKNPKSAGQAEQRAKLLAVNATYRALKMVIDRGNEGLPYGNESRLAWLKGALKAEGMPWLKKGSIPSYLVGCQISKGSLTDPMYQCDGNGISIVMDGVTSETAHTTVADLTTALIAAYPNLKIGDQITIGFIDMTANGNNVSVISFLLSDDPADTLADFGLTASVSNGRFSLKCAHSANAAFVIMSRQGDNGEHLRSNAMLKFEGSVLTAAPYDAGSKTAAIASYRASAASNSDWAEESIQ